MLKQCLSYSQVPKLCYAIKDCRELLMNDDFIGRVIALVLDEAHCIAKWYVLTLGNKIIIKKFFILNSGGQSFSAFTARQ